MVDPLKVEAIIQLPPPRTILQLQILQGKANFLQRFIANYAEITKGFMHLLKKDVPFYWDDTAQCSFDALKHALTTAPLLRQPNYNKYFLLYLAVTESTIGMVLVREDDLFSEYVIYYLELKPRRTGTQLFSYRKTCVGSSSCHSTILSLCSVSQDHRHCYCESIPVHVETMGYRQRNQ
jgi:hypothetical protein